MNVESAKIKQINLSKNYRQNIILIRDQITSEKVSLSYFLEYIMKDYLENKKRYIQRLHEVEQIITKDPIFSGEDSELGSERQLTINESEDTFHLLNPCKNGSYENAADEKDNFEAARIFQDTKNEYLLPNDQMKINDLNNKKNFESNELDKRSYESSPYGQGINNDNLDPCYVFHYESANFEKTTGECQRWDDDKMWSSVDDRNIKTPDRKNTADNDDKISFKEGGDINFESIPTNNKDRDDTNSPNEQRTHQKKRGEISLDQSQRTPLGKGVKLN